MSDEDLSTAASLYAAANIPEHADPAYLRLAIELAFMQSATWYNSVVIARGEARLAELNKELEELQEVRTNA